MLTRSAGLTQRESSGLVQRAGLDPVVLEQIQECVEWMREAEDQVDKTIVGFWMG
ncbi:hypothetical protein ACW2Q0_27270 [Nocardia sp. R16R-3T]